MGSTLAGRPVDAVGLGSAHPAGTAVGAAGRDVRVMRQSASRMTLSWVDPVIPAWYTGTFQRATALPTTLRMTAPAHFMEHRYLSFNAPVKITPPPRR